MGGRVGLCMRVVIDWVRALAEQDAPAALLPRVRLGGEGPGRRIRRVDLVHNELDLPVPGPDAEAPTAARRDPFSGRHDVGDTVAPGPEEPRAEGADHTSK